MDEWTRLAFEVGRARLDIDIAAIRRLNDDVIGQSGRAADRRAGEAWERLFGLVAA